jgi:acetamidase/formamidase
MRTTLEALLVSAAAVSIASAQERVQFKPEVGHPTFAVREPVLRLKPGTILVSNTMMGPYYTEAGGAFPGEVGPFYIEGATTKDTLVVEILKVRPNHDIAASQVSGSFGGLAGEKTVRFLADPIPDRRYVWRLDRERMTGKTTLPGSKMREIEIELEPMLGRVGVAPRGEEAFAGLWPGDFGGNMDAPEVREGTTVYLPIFHDGAYVYFGDGHAKQGEGEVAGTGLETSMDVELRFDLIKGKTIDWPRLEDENYIMVAGSARPLMDAFRLAHVELIEWLVEDYGFDRLDAYALLGQLAVSTVANIVDPAYTVLAKYPKKYLPK